MSLDDQTKRLAYHLGRIPEQATGFRVITSGLGGGQVICEYTKDEIIESTQEVAERIVSSADSWVSNAEKVFIGQWLAENNRILDAMKWRMNPDASSENGGNNWDGSPEQLIQHLVNKLQEKDRVFIEMLRIAFEFSQQQMSSIMERNMYLEKQRIDTEKIKEELIRMEADLETGHEDTARFNRLMGLAEKLLTAQAGPNRQ